MRSNFPKTKQPLPTRGVTSTSQIWLKQMSEADTKLWGMQQKPLWVIENKVYDLTQFINKHPGGSSWLTMTKGQDITTLFVTHHLDQHKTRQILKKYYMSEAKIKNQPRFQFTQHYNQIRKRILNKFSIKQLHDTSYTSFVCYTILIGWFLLVAICSYLKSFILAIICGFLMLSFYGIGHLFIHRKTPNLLSHTFLLIGFTAREQRIVHALSHHPYPNTMLDYQFAGFEPIMNFARFLPSGKWYSFMVMQLLFVFIAPINLLTKIIAIPILTKGNQKISWQHLICLSIIIFMELFTKDYWIAFKIWTVIILFYGFALGKFIACEHRQLQLWSENSPQIRDIVFHILATTNQTNHSPMSAFSSLIFYSGFNIHAIHHLFPTIDHSKIPACNEIFMQYCKQKGLKVLINSSMLDCNKNMWKLQLGRKQFHQRSFFEK